MIDEERSSFYHNKFGDVAAFHLLPEDPLFLGTKRLTPPKNGKFTVAEWHEFLNYLATTGYKMKAGFYDGQILIEECNMHGVHESCLNVMVGTVFAYNRANAGFDADILEALGHTDFHVSRSYIMPDATWVPEGGSIPSIFMEVANTQSVESLLVHKVELVLRNSVNSRYVIVIKIWRDPLPDNIAMVCAVWMKTNQTPHAHEWLAIKFTSFGSRPPTALELASFPVTPGDRPWVPDLDGVIEGPGNVQCNLDHSTDPMFTVTLLTAHMFDVPNIATPAHLLALPPLHNSLYLTKTAIVRTNILDIISGRYELNNEQLGLIVSSIDVQQNHPHLRAYALQCYQIPGL